MANYRGPSLPGSILGAVVLLITVAAGARVAYELLAPLVPLLVGLLILFVVVTTLFKR